MKKLLALFWLLPTLALAGDFITNPSNTLFPDKIANQSLPSGANPANYVRASDINTLKYAMLDTRDEVWALMAGQTGGGVVTTGYLSTQLKGTTAEGFPTSTDGGVNRTMLDMILRDSSGNPLGTSTNKISVDTGLTPVTMGRSIMDNSFSFTLASDQPAVAITNLPPGATKFRCWIDNVTATTQLTNCGAPGSGLYFYITKLVMANAATAQSIQLVYGTGTNCGTGQAAATIQRWFNANAGTEATYPVDSAWQVPAANVALCAKPSSTGAISVEVVGYTAPTGN